MRLTGNFPPLTQLLLAPVAILVKSLSQRQSEQSAIRARCQGNAPTVIMGMDGPRRHPVWSAVRGGINKTELTPRRAPVHHIDVLDTHSEHRGFAAMHSDAWSDKSSKIGVLRIDCYHFSWKQTE